MGLTIALAGNPNCGKTTLFNALTGSSQRVGNWPGVTIDKKVGKIKGTDHQLVDLPGIYSLSPYSPEEIVSRNFIIQDKPDAVINIVDATNLERNLFLSLQLIDTGRPMVIALNMMDEIDRLGDKIDADGLSKALGVQVVPISAAKKTNIDKLVEAVTKAAEAKQRPNAPKYDESIEKAVAAAEEAIKGKVPEESSRFYAFKLLEGDSAVEEALPGSRESLKAVIDELEEKNDDSADSIITDSRYDMISETVSKTVKKAERDERGSLSDRVDRIVTSRILGIPIFIAVIAAVYFIAMYDGDWGVSPGAWATGWLNDAFGELGEIVREWCENNGVDAIVTGLLVDGIIGGVGAVLGFLPQMIILFICLVILEEVGYMARVAFVMDRVFRYFNLSGKSFIPLLVGTGCGIPGVMSSRTIESESDRRITAMTVTFMPCGAKLPVISAIAGAIAGSWWIALFAYFGGIVMVIMSGIILKKFKSLAGTPAPFIMELPPYHMPSFFTSAKAVLDRAWAFVKKAGTIILLTAILIWFLSHFDLSLSFIEADEDLGESILAGIGNIVSYLFVPIGWGDSWELASASITGLIAKENLVATLGIVLLGDGEAEEELISLALASLLSQSGILSFFAFNMFCAPCFAAIGAIHRELGTWKMTGIAVVYQCLMAYMVASIVYVVFGTLIGDPIAWYSYLAAAVCAAILAYLLAAKDPFRQLGRREAAR